MSKSYTKEQIEKLKSELKDAIRERDYLKQCCIDAGIELSKYSFGWDGKEKNLVVQALHLNEMYKELKAKNEQLKTQVFGLESKQTSMGEQNKELTGDNLNLYKENAKLKEKFEIESLTDKTTGETIYRSNVVNKLKELLELRIEDLCESCKVGSMMPMPCTVYKQALREIKAIAEAPKPFIDFSGIKTLTEVEYDYAAIYNELELRLHKVLELITKAEEE